jgi:aryl-alcohol dehydrogenase-like predicted oxidoreductase
MRMRRLGRSGLAVSVVGLGCNNFGWRIGRAAVAAVVHAAVDAGITLFDTADIYGRPHGTSESLLGEALAGHRDEVVLATKFGKDMEGVGGPDWGARGSRRYVRSTVEASLRRLGTDRIDLLQLHEPDPATPIEETLSALDDLVRAGKVLALGSSQFAGWQVTEAEWTARASGTSRFVGTQQKYSLIDRDAERELIPACLAAGVGLLPFFPLESGLLTGKYRRGAAAPAGSRLAIDGYSEFLQRAPWDMVEAVEAFAAERGLTMLDVAVGGLAARPCVVSVIAGATSPEQVRANAAAGGWEPSEADRAELDRLTAGAGQDRT